MKSKQITIILHVVIWGAVLVLPYFLRTPGPHYARIGGMNCNFFTLTNLLHIGLFYFNAFFLYPRFLTFKRWWIYFLLLPILVIIVFLMKLPILRIWFPELAEDRMAIPFTLFPVVFFLVISFIYRLVLDKMNQERISANLKTEQLASELKFLRSQVSPHFLFNVLNNLVSMARHKSDRLEPALMKLSGLMRYMLYESDEQKVRLATEIDYLVSYIELQRLRFEEDVTIRTHLDYKGGTLDIEPMLLIPFVENAFKHGVAVSEKAFITIDLHVRQEVLYFKVTNSYEDNDQPKDKDSGIGLDNLSSRLKLLYPGRHELMIERKNGIFISDLQLTLT